MSFVRALAVAAALVVGAGTVPAAAQQAAAGTPEAKFATAQKHYEQRDYKTALTLFREAFESSGSPNAGLYVARCLRELGQLPEAYAEMRRTMRSAGDRVRSERRYAGTLEAAKTELAALEAMIGLVTVSVADAADVEVTLNGTRLAPTDINQPLPVAPGTVIVGARTAGKPAFSRELQIAAGASENVAITFGAEDAPAPAAASGPSAGPTETRGGELRVLGFVVAGVGVAGIGIFAVSGSMARSKFDTIQEECHEQRCIDPKYSGEIETGRTLTILANVGLVTGIVGIAGGAALIALGGPRKAQARSDVSLAVSPQGGALSLRGAFW